MKLNILLKKNLIKVLVIALLLVALIISLYLVKRSQDIRNRAAGTGAIHVYLDPPSTSIITGGSTTIKVMLRNTSSSDVSINVGTVDTGFNPNDLTISGIDCNSGLLSSKYQGRVDGNKILLTCGVGGGDDPVTIQSGNVNDIELGHFTITPLTGVQQTTIIVDNTLIPDLNATQDLSDAGTGGTYSFTGTSSSPTPTATGVPGQTGTPTLTPTPTGPTLTPSPTPSPTGVVFEASTPTLIPTATRVPSVTLTPTPPSGQEGYTIDIGTKAVLSIKIGSGNTPQVKFTAKLAGAEGHPDMYFKLRAKDDLAFVDNPNSGPTCESPGAGGVDLYVPMKADNSGIYTPVTGINISAPAGAVVATVSADGWVSLTGLSAGKYYTLNLKGSKTRGTEMLKHVLLSGGQSASQNYDWTDNGLQPGDLPDPNNSNKQDCAVNSVDISLIISRLGKTDVDSLNIADVSYDGVVNANDIAQVVGTLSTKPDDDN